MVRLRFETDLATSLRASADLAKATERVANAYTKTAKEATALEKAAARIVQQNLTPQERYNQKLETMAKAVKAGKLSMDDAERTAGRLRQRLDEAGKSGVAAFGARALSQLTSYAAGFVSVTAVIGAVSNALRQMEADADRASAGILNSLGAIGELQQLASGGTREERQQSFLKLLGESRGLIGPVFTADQQTEAVSLVTQLKAQGFSPQGRQFFYQALGELAVDPKNAIELAKGIGKYRTQTGGRPEDIFAEVLRGSVPGTSTAAEFALQSLKPLQAGKALGLTRQEILAGTAIAELAAENIEVGATQFNTFLEQVEKRGLGGGNLQAILNRVQSRIDKGQTVYDVLGEARAVRGFRGLQGQRAALDLLGTDILGAPGGDVLAEHFGLFRADPRARAAQRKKISEGRYTETFGAFEQEREDLFDALRAEVMTDATRRGQPVSREMARFMSAIVDFFNQEEQSFGAALRDPNMRGRVSPALETDLRDYLRRIAESNEHIERNETRIKPSGRPE